MKYKFTKDDTFAIKGIAIIFLLCIHCIAKDRIEGLDVSYWPLSESAASWLITVMSECVGIFEFLSVYGMTLSVKNKYPQFEYTRTEALADALRRYFSLVFKFLMPFIVCFTVTYGMGVHRYHEGTVRNAINLVLDVLCVGKLFGTQMMVPTWWYMSLEVLLIVFLPLIILFYKKYSGLSILMVLAVGTAFSEQLTVDGMTKFMLVIPIAVWAADQNILEKIKAYHIVKNNIINKLIKIFIWIILIYTVIWLRGIYSSGSNLNFLLRGIMPVFLVCFSYEIIVDIPVIRQILVFFGKNSAYIFYIHSFVRGIWFKNKAYSFHSGWMIVAFVFAVTLIISFVIDEMCRVTGYNKLTGNLVKKITNKVTENFC